MGIFQKLFGGGGKGQGGKMNEVLQALGSDLNLTREQENEVQQVFQNFKQQRREIKSSGGEKSQIQQAKQQLKENILGILNDQQKQIFAANAGKYDAILHGGQE
jgi:hypothetical protein